MSGGRIFYSILSKRNTPAICTTRVDIASDYRANPTVLATRSMRFYPLWVVRPKLELLLANFLPKQLNWWR